MLARLCRRWAVLSVVLVLIGQAMADDGTEQSLQQGREDLMNAAFEIELSGDPDFDFTRVMVAHQNAAVALATQLLKQSDDERLVRVARLIVENHQAESEQLSTWLGRYDEANPGRDAEQIRAIYQTVLDGVADDREEFRVAGDADWVFANAMIWHNELSIALGQVMLNHSVDAQLRILAGDVVRNANRDIAELRNWMQSRELEASQ